MAKKKVKETEKTKKIEEQQEIAYITFVLDESSSMGSGRTETIAGVNQQIATLKKDFPMDGKIKAVVSFIKFASTVTPVFLNKTLDELTDINEQNYSPNGMTSMYDGVGLAIDELSKRDDIDSKSTSILLVVISDGQENNSRKYNSEQIANKVKELNETGRWTITYLGANQDLSKVSKQTNLSLGNTQSFSTADKDSFSKGYVMASTSLHRYAESRSVGSMAMNDFYSNDEVKVNKDEVKLDVNSISGSTSKNKK